MRNTFARRVFRFAGIYGLVVRPPQYFLAERLGRDAPPPLTHLEKLVFGVPACGREA